jgi:hypothetical protein
MEVTMTKKRLDAEAVLRRLAEIRKGIPFLADRPPVMKRTDERSKARTVEEFEEQAVIDGLESLSDELSAAIQERHAKAVQEALRVYYTAEEMAKDPAHADLIPHVKSMREAYEKSYGHPIPPKPKE